MMKQYFIKYLLFILLTPLLSAQAEVDSLRTLLNSLSGKQRIPVIMTLMEKIDRENPKAAISYGKEALRILSYYSDKDSEATIYFRLGWSFCYDNNLDSAKYYAELAGNTARASGFSKGEVMEHFLLARISRIEGLHDEAIKHLDLAFEKNELTGDILFKAKILNEKGSVLRRMSRYDEAYELHKQTLELFKNFRDDEELRTTYTYLGIISDLKARYDDALKYHHEALKLSNKMSDRRGAAASNHNLGILYQKIDKYDDALGYYHNALKYWKEVNSVDGLASTLNSIGAIHELKGELDEALVFYKQALEIWEDSGTKFSKSIGQHNVGTIYAYLGNYIEASDYLQRSIDIGREIGDKNGTASSLTMLSFVLDKLGRKDDAIKTAKEGNRLAEEIGNMSTLRHSYKILADIYENNGQYKEALDEFKKYQVTHDSIFNMERQQVIAEMQEKYKSEEQKQQIEILQKDSEIQSLHRTYLIIGIILLILFILLLYNRYRLKQRAHIALEKLHESEVEGFNLKSEAAESKAAIMQVEYDQKTKELNAARELQLSMLPSDIPVLREMTVAAKMITATEVGGDYYDFYEGKDNSFTIAIGDATGHGARAGIMVTAVKSLFNHLSCKENITDILCRLTDSIKKMRFKNLFMAFALMRIKGNELEYAGAGMPPAFIFRSGTGEIEELSLKGLPLGIAKGHEYNKCTTKLNKGDTVLLMSDGFPELFNLKKESLGYEQVPILLKQYGKNSPEEIINQLTETAQIWLDGNNQQDDMTFVVFKMK